MLNQLMWSPDSSKAEKVFVRKKSFGRTQLSSSFFPGIARPIKRPTFGKQQVKLISRLV